MYIVPILSIMMGEYIKTSLKLFRHLKFVRILIVPVNNFEVLYIKGKTT